jgi:hypothetical protein
MDPIVSAARSLADAAFGVLRRATDGLPAEALDWESAGPDTNSIAVLATHSLNATRLLLSLAVGAPQPDRDRDAEFEATSGGSARLLTLIDEIGGECLAILDDAPSEIDWAESRTMHRSDGSTAERPAAFYIVHAVDHLRGHADEASLTRHVWEAR